MNSKGTEADTFNFYYPIVQLTIQKHTLTLKRETLRAPPLQEKKKRRKITRMTAPARARLAHLTLETSVNFQSLMTLTFGEVYPKSGLTVKRIINKFLNWMRSVKELAYIWYLEFQTRGAPHVHFLVSWDYDQVLHLAIAKRWAVLVGRELSLSVGDVRKLNRQHRRARTFEKVREEDGAKRYCLKYALKAEQKEVPNQFKDVGRFWGASRNVRESVDPGQTVEVDEIEARALCEKYGIPHQKWEFLPKILFRRNVL